MATAETAGRVTGDDLGILDREHTIAKAGFNRWLVPPAALCIHLCIGMAYGFSVFWLPLSRAIGITQSKACPDISLWQEVGAVHAEVFGYIRPVATMVEVSGLISPDLLVEIEVDAHLDG